MEEISLSYLFSISKCLTNLLTEDPIGLRGRIVRDCLKLIGINISFRVQDSFVDDSVDDFCNDT